MDDKIQSYRQPLVTATGIVLGFVLNIANSWAAHAFATNLFKEKVIAAGLFICILLLIIVLYRILNMDYPKEKAHEYYKYTLHFFIGGIVVIFFSIIIVMIESYLIHKNETGG